MTTKTNNLVYWISTIIFSGLMLFSAVGGIKPSEQSIQIIHDGLGYPVYFIQFISIAKILGVVIILIPMRGRIKDWAYAGLFFDLAGAVYSGIVASPRFDPLILTMLIWIVPGIVSYYCWLQKVKRGLQVGVK